jgi:hypothetical protein
MFTAFMRHIPVMRYALRVYRYKKRIGDSKQTRRMAHGGWRASGLCLNCPLVAGGLSLDYENYLRVLSIVYFGFCIRRQLFMGLILD